MLVEPPPLQYLPPEIVYFFLSINLLLTLCKFRECWISLLRNKCNFSRVKLKQLRVTERQGAGATRHEYKPI